MCGTSLGGPFRGKDSDHDDWSVAVRSAALIGCECAARLSPGPGESGSAI